MHIWLMLIAVFGLLACESPEATRTRGGGPGADLGNRGKIVQIHGGAEPFYKTPQLIASQRALATKAKSNQASGQ